MAKEKVGLYRDPRKQNPWIVRWFGDIDPTSGKQRRYSKAFRLKAVAEKFQIQKAQELNDGNPRDKADRVTLGAFCKDWLKSRKTELQPATYDLYLQTVKRLEGYFGKTLFLKDVTPKQAAVFVSQQKSVADKHEGEPLSGWTIEQIKRHCKTIFGTAVEWKLLPSNPFGHLRRKKQGTTRWHRVTVKEYQALLEVAPSFRWKAFYALAYTSGCRMGELFSLMWSDVDFEQNRLIISNRESTVDLPPFHIKDHEIRQIPLPQHTIDVLTKWQAQAPEGVPYILLSQGRFELVKAKWQNLRKKGQPWRNQYMVNNVLRDFKSHFRRAGIKPIAKLTIHTLRKSCGQNWADNLPMHVVKELMGHSSIQTTQEFYTQLDAEHQAKAARVIQQLIDSSQQDESNKSDAGVTPETISN